MGLPSPLWYQNGRISVPEWAHIGTRMGGFWYQNGAKRYQNGPNPVPECARSGKTSPNAARYRVDVGTIMPVPLARGRPPR
jgi:hypothetical protein